MAWLNVCLSCCPFGRSFQCHLLDLLTPLVLRRRAIRKVTRVKKPAAAPMTKATTTPLVSDLFENFFKGQIQNDDKVRRAVISSVGCLLAVFGSLFAVTISFFSVLWVTYFCWSLMFGRCGSYPTFM